MSKRRVRDAIFAIICTLGGQTFQRDHARDDYE